MTDGTHSSGGEPKGVSLVQVKLVRSFEKEMVWKIDLVGLEVAARPANAGQPTSCQAG